MKCVSVNILLAVLRNPEGVFSSYVGSLRNYWANWSTFSVLVFKSSQRKKDGEGRFGTEEATRNI